MTSKQLQEHLNYWRDPIKRARYAAALAERVDSDSVVLDMGSGTGLLGLLALRAGAARVIAVERGEIIGPARQLAQRNGLADRIEFRKGHSTKIDLPQVDLVVCDQIGGLVHDAGVLRMYADLVERDIVPVDGLVPSSFELFLAPVEAPRPHAQVSGWADDEFDVSVMAALAANTEQRVGPRKVRCLAPGQRFDSRAAHELRGITANLEFEVEAPGTLHGFVGWFRTQLSPSVTMTNAPHEAERMNRWLNFYPLANAFELPTGATVSVELRINVETSVTAWRATVNGELLDQQSTFHGDFRSSEGLGFGDPA